MTDWKRASIDWNTFLRDVLLAREQVGCQSRSAWYRGTKQENFDLAPTLYRSKTKTLGQIFEISTGCDVYGFVSSEPKQRKELLERWWNKAAAGRQLRHAINEQIRTASSFQSSASSSKGKHLDDGDLLYLLNGFGYVLQEIDAFHEFKNRSRMGNAGSWLLLANMRHHGVPVRLLDWTESFVIALYFALESCIEELTKHWSPQTGWDLNGFPPFPQSKVVQDIEPMAIWVLNPFHLAQLSGIYGSIPYPDLSPLPDYYDELLIKKSWPYKRPIPIHADKNSTRMESQRGHFTVHGYCPDPLNIQIYGKNEQDDIEEQSSVLRKVRINSNAAIYGSFFLWQFVNFDCFELFRDLDSLGKVVSKRHFDM